MFSEINHHHRHHHPQGLNPVSYTHLDVYKRQLQVGGTACRLVVGRGAVTLVMTCTTTPPPNRIKSISRIGKFLYLHQFRGGCCQN